MVQLIKFSKEHLPAQTWTLPSLFKYSLSIRTECLLLLICGWSITLTKREDSIWYPVFQTGHSVLSSPHIEYALATFSQGSCWNSPLWTWHCFVEILIDVHNCRVEYSSLLCGCLCVLYKCGDHPSCHSDWCMGSLCVPLSYLSESSAVHCGACLLHHACGCPLSEAIGCERRGDLCLKGGWGKAGGRRRGGG